MAVNRRRILFTALAILVLLILISGILFYRVTWGGNILVFKQNSPSYVLDKINAQTKQGGSVQLTEGDLNGILNMYVKQGIAAQGFSVAGIYTKLSDGELSLYVQGAYKGISLLLFARGTLNYENDSLDFAPSQFKMGKINLPVDFVLNKLFALAGEKATISEGHVYIAKDLLPMEIQSLKLEGTKLIVEVPKEPETQPQKQQPKQPAKTTTSAPVKSAQEVLLARASRQLRGVYASVETDGEKAIIAKIQTVVNKMLQNPGYPYQAEADVVKSQYRSLTENERSDIKDCILDNMDNGTLKQIKNMFDL